MKSNDLGKVMSSKMKMSSQDGTIDGKAICENGRDWSDVLVVGDSHHAKLGGFWATHGASMIAIRGGGIQHAEKATQGKYSKIFILELGGNDLIKNGGLEVAKRLRRLVAQLLDRRSTDMVITGSPIPRTAGPIFVEEFIKFENNMTRVQVGHHHHHSDIFLDDNRIGTDRSMFATDLTHLNSKGTQILSQQMEWVMESINMGVFEGRSRPVVRKSPTDYRGTWWKF